MGAGVGVEEVEVAVRDLITMLDILGIGNGNEAARDIRDIGLLIMMGSVPGDEMRRSREQEQEQEQDAIGGRSSAGLAIHRESFSVVLVWFRTSSVFASFRFLGGIFCQFLFSASYSPYSIQPRSEIQHTSPPSSQRRRSRFPQKFHQKLHNTKTGVTDLKT